MKDKKKRFIIVLIVIVCFVALIMFYNRKPKELKISHFDLNNLNENFCDDAYVNVNFEITQYHKTDYTIADASIIITITPEDDHVEFTGDYLHMDIKLKTSAWIMQTNAFVSGKTSSDGSYDVLFFKTANGEYKTGIELVYDENYFMQAPDDPSVEEIIYYYRYTDANLTYFP